MIDVPHEISLLNARGRHRAPSSPAGWRRAPPLAMDILRISMCAKRRSAGAPCRRLTAQPLAKAGAKCQLLSCRPVALLRERRVTIGDSMKLGTLPGGRDGRLVVVSADL